MTKKSTQHLEVGRQTTQVFLSYSRKDADFARTLLTTLESRSIDVFQDVEDIMAIEAWRARLTDLLSKADAVVCVISPDSAVSRECNWEVDYAVRLNKRLAPIVFRPTDLATIPFHLTELNHISFIDPAEYPASVDKLVTALKTDIEWVRTHTRLGELARRWDALKRRSTSLVAGQDLKDAEQWLAGHPEGAPPPDELTRHFIEESRTCANRRKRYMMLGVGAAALVAAVTPFVLFPSQSHVAVMRVPAAFKVSQSDVLPLSPGSIATLRSSIAKLAPRLSRITSDGVRYGDAVNAWTIAVTSVSTNGLQKSDVAATERYFYSKFDGNCGCWRELSDKQPHTGSTASVLYSMAEQGIEIPKKAVDFLLDLQHEDGWWPLHPTTSHAQNASTYATAWSTLAFYSIMQRSTDPVQRPRIEAAIAKSRAWLQRSKSTGEPRWSDYPGNGLGKISVGVSGLVLYVQHRTTTREELAATARDWLDQLPVDVVDGAAVDLTNTAIRLKSGEIDHDRTRNVRLPWAIAASVDAYASGTAWQKAKVVAWLELVLQKNPVTEDILDQQWIAAELLLALRHLERKVH